MCQLSLPCKVESYATFHLFIHQGTLGHSYLLGIVTNTAMNELSIPSYQAHILGLPLRQSYRERRREIFHVLVQFSNGHNSWGWAMPKQAAFSGSPTWAQGYILLFFPSQ